VPLEQPSVPSPVVASVKVQASRGRLVAQAWQDPPVMQA
jgi:hypothetical protein